MDTIKADIQALALVFACVLGCMLAALLLNRAFDALMGVLS